MIRPVGVSIRESVRARDIHLPPPPSESLSYLRALVPLIDEIAQVPPPTYILQVLISKPPACIIQDPKDIHVLLEGGTNKRAAAVNRGADFKKIMNKLDRSRRACIVQCDRGAALRAMAVKEGNNLLIRCGLRLVRRPRGAQFLRPHADGIVYRVGGAPLVTLLVKEADNVEIPVQRGVVHCVGGATLRPVLMKEADDLEFPAKAALSIARVVQPSDLFSWRNWTMSRKCPAAQSIAREVKTSGSPVSCRNLTNDRCPFSASSSPIAVMRGGAAGSRVGYGAPISRRQATMST
ncbi:hypothetical protein BDK51DRAFT_47303 [Blyttiomyces helicus]|uniref:Uncharacterized protein n=1 Tax=Blyttiomyces helicus TaxID=388810 RepID=A0A4P9WE22_9FUNG|nr:hypothetical protein BDK51DRAFT_47303 [Blyttiomyces helicus]|eukprot:RKO89933.1 hypothetical protein BDK51DRAFT_47303 [Blyttiomyces helicus]